MSCEANESQTSHTEVRRKGLYGRIKEMSLLTFSEIVQQSSSKPLKNSLI